MDYVSKLKLYRDAGVREYWICDPRQSRTLIYAFESDQLIFDYAFNDPARSVIFAGFEVTIAELILP